MEGTIKLLFLLSDIHSCIPYEIVDDLVLPILLDTSWIDLSITRIFKLERVTIHVHSSWAAIFWSYSYEKVTNGWLPTIPTRITLTYNRQTSAKLDKQINGPFQFERRENHHTAVQRVSGSHHIVYLWSHYSLPTFECSKDRSRLTAKRSYWSCSEQVVLRRYRKFLSSTDPHTKTNEYRHCVSPPDHIMYVRQSDTTMSLGKN